MRVAEHVRVENVRVFADLRRGMQAAAGVVEVDMPLGIEPPVLDATQGVERRRLAVLGVFSQEFIEGTHMSIVACLSLDS